MKKKDKLKDYAFAIITGILFGCLIAFADWYRFFL